MSRLFDRRAVLTVASGTTFGAGLEFALEFPCGNDGFDLRFSVRKDLTAKPNRGEIIIYNLTQDHRDALSERVTKGAVRVRLEAGYGADIHRIYEGDVRILEHSKDTGVDFATKIELGDGDHIVSAARVSKSWAPGTRVSTVIRDLAKLLDIGEGNVRASTAGALLEGLGPTFPGGTAASGRAFVELTRICRSAGLEWSIQDGTLQFLETDKALAATATVVTSATGMEGAAKLVPSKKGPRLHVQMRMLPNVWPGRKIQLADKSVWVVSKAHYQGETRGHSWGIQVEATHVD